jgi:Mg/Co/Ni transporter MgtE
VPGKVDWIARMLPTEGTEAGRPRVGELARDDVVTCGLEAPVAGIGDRVRESRYGFALVLAADRTLLGRLRLSKLRDADAGATAQQVMDPGPSTVRPDISPDDLRERLDKRDLKTSLVSDPEGKLIGVVHRDDLG